MIGVLASASQHCVIREFFNLFKTPWEFYHPETEYDVLLCSESQAVPSGARLVLLYSARQAAFDAEAGVSVLKTRQAAAFSYAENLIPIYGDCLVFSGPGKPILQTESGETIALEIQSAGRTIVRLGFDLFREIEYLLKQGQPFEHARTPTLDLQIALLRELIVDHSIPLFEIPPVPANYKFIVCLTHDVDHLGIKNHWCDHTMLGFLFRALVGSLAGFIMGRRSFGQLAANWKAAVSLPLVYLGLIEDFWKTVRRYREIEQGLASTFFVIPRRDNPGIGAEGPAPSQRAAHYGIEEIQDEIKNLVEDGCEVALHGIDAWHDPSSGRAEMAVIRSLTGEADIGVRMHWLYFDKHSPVHLEEAGFSYDSTVGYNETVGFRAGTLQAFKPLGVDRLLELPMHVMDTALFFPTHLNLSSKKAKVILEEMVEKAIRFGGALTINWHDRSIAPERLWDRPYIDLLADLEGKGAWFATCLEAVSWFKQRRAAVIEQKDGARIKVTMDSPKENLPDCFLRLHNARSTNPAPCHVSGQAAGFSDLVLSDSKEITWSHSSTMVTPACS